MMKVVGVIQARLGSTRLPEKALKPILGKPMIWYQWERMMMADSVDDVVIATSDLPQNQAIVEVCAKLGIPCYAGSEEDLIDRVFQAMKQMKGDLAVWSGADCPLMEPDLIDRVVQVYQNDPDNIDYVSNSVHPTFPHGLDFQVVPMRLIEKLWNEISDPHWREWICQYVLEHPNDYSIASVESDQDLTHHRWTVDYPEDFELVREIIEHLYPNNKQFTMNDILALLEQKPELNKINAKYAYSNELYESRKKQENS